MASAPNPILERCAAMALAAIQREYPSHVSLLLNSDADVRPPRELTPAFYGSFDWHSSVHGHWSLIRLARTHPGAAFVADARAAVGRSLTPERLAGEHAYMEPRPWFERPYGLAWLLQLCAELREWDDAEARSWQRSLEPLERLAADRLEAWVARLPWPIRSGVHNQSAYALGLAIDWAAAAGEEDRGQRFRARARSLYESDRDAPIGYEPSGHDFLSATLGEVDLMRRVLDPDEFGTWLTGFVPDWDSEVARRWLAPAVSPDPADGHLAHLDGLNLSRAWMLEGIVHALAATDTRRARLEEAADAHRAAGLTALSGDHYAGTHWLGSFAVYLLTRRGIRDGEGRAAVSGPGR